MPLARAGAAARCATIFIRATHAFAATQQLHLGGDDVHRVLFLAVLVGELAVTAPGQSTAPQS
jgi:hypothetical protein